MTLYIEAESNDNFAIFSVATGTFFFRWLANLFWHCRQLSLVSFTLDFALARLLSIHFLFHIFYEIRHFVVYVVLFLWFEDFMITTTLLKKTVFFIGDSVEKKNVYFYRLFDFLSMPFCHFIWKFFYFFVV